MLPIVQILTFFGAWCRAAAVNSNNIYYKLYKKSTIALFVQFAVTRSCISASIPRLLIIDIYIYVLMLVKECTKQ